MLDIIEFLNVLAETRVVSKEHALKEGNLYFLTLKSCKYGHICRRYIDNKTSRCSECVRLKNHNCFKTNKNKYYEYAKKWYLNNPDKAKIIRKTKYTNWYSKDINKKTSCDNSNKRRAFKLKAMPNWVNLDEIKTFYLGCPKGYEVDHIVPLNNKIVCGLHVVHNLQYLSKFDNRSKGNRLCI